MIDYALTRSNRKTIALYVRNGTVEVRAPLKTARRDIDNFVLSKEKWINGKMAASYKQQEQRENFSLTYGDFILYHGKEYSIAAKPGNRAGFDGKHQNWLDLKGKGRFVRYWNTKNKSLLSTRNKEANNS